MRVYFFKILLLDAVSKRLICMQKNKSCSFNQKKLFKSISSRSEKYALVHVLLFARFYKDRFKGII